MIVLCPKCKSKYRVDETKIGDEGVKLRCQNCQIIFRVKKPAAAPAAAPAPRPPAAAPRPTVPPRPVPAPAAAPPKPKAPPVEPISGPFIPEVAPKATVLVADVDEDYLRAIIRDIVGGGYTVYVARDGNAALSVIQDKIPEIAILEVVLPGKFGFEVSEMVKSDPFLKEKVKVILLGSVYEKDRFRRAPQSLYGADSYIEKHHNGKEVLAKIAELMAPEAAAPPTPRPAAPAPPKAPPAPAAVPRTAPPPQAAPPRPAAAPPKAPPAPAAVPRTAPPPQAAPPRPAPPTPAAAPPPAAPRPTVVAPTAPPAAPRPPTAPPRPAAAPLKAPPAPAAAPRIPPGAGEWAAQVPDDPVHQKAARLARTTVADIALYNPKELEQGLRDGNWRDILAKDIEDGKKHWVAKTPPEVRGDVDYFELALQDLEERKKKEYGLA